MCGRYTLYQTKELKERFNLAQSKELDKLLEGLRANYNVAPGQELPVITQNSPRKLNLMRWGLVPHWAKDQKIGYHMINARAETVFSKPAWKYPVLNNRCLIPANGFYEWQVTSNGKQPFYIRAKNHGLIAFAGFFDQWTNKSTGETLKSFSIITTQANQQMISIHDRMPVILQPEDEARWLEVSNKTPESIADMIKPLANDKLDMHPVSPDVNDAHHNNEHLIGPLNKNG